MNNISFRLYLSVIPPSAQTTSRRVTDATAKTNGVASSIRPPDGSSSVGNVIPIPSQVPAFSEFGEEQKDSTLFTRRNDISSAEPHKNIKTLNHGGAHYIGEVDKDDLPSGEGTLTFSNGTVYEGKFKKGMYHGKGKLTQKNGKVCDGLFDNGQFIKPSKGCCIIQ